MTLSASAFILEDHRIPSAGQEQVFEQDLDPGERRVVQGLHDWLTANPDALWERSLVFPGVEQCQRDDFIKITLGWRPKTPKNAMGIILRISQPAMIENAGDLMAISPSQDCCIHDGPFSYVFKYGKKFHMPRIYRRISLHVRRGEVLYLFWLVEKGK